MASQGVELFFAGLCDDNPTKNILFLTHRRAGKTTGLANAFVREHERTTNDEDRPVLAMPSERSRNMLRDQFPKLADWIITHAEMDLSSAGGTGSLFIDEPQLLEVGYRELDSRGSPTMHPGTLLQYEAQLGNRRIIMAGTMPVSCVLVDIFKVSRRPTVFRRLQCVLL